MAVCDMGTFCVLKTNGNFRPNTKAYPVQENFSLHLVRYHLINRFTIVSREKGIRKITADPRVLGWKSVDESTCGPKSRRICCPSKGKPPTSEEVRWLVVDTRGECCLRNEG
jgi:hypothetical protein